MKSILIVLSLAIPTVTLAENSLYRLETTYQTAGNYHGSIFGLSSDVSLSESLRLLPRAENLQRTFDAGPSFNETTLSLGFAQRLSRRTYLLGGAGVTPNAQILPRYQAYLDPHFASGAWDFGFRASFASWVDQDAGSLAPSAYYEFSDSLAVSDSVSFVRSDAWYVSNATQFIFRPVDRSVVRLVPAFGRTLEAAGAPATFSSIAAEASYEVWRSIRVGLGATVYNSTLRKENSFLLRLEAW